jgi:signal transduction histidine kinase
MMPRTNLAVFRWPRPTVRLKLSLLYGGLFLGSAVALLALTTFLVRSGVGSVAVTPGQMLVFPGPDPASQDVHRVIVSAALALAIMGVLSFALGWVVAGRLLRPLRTITAAARDISATNLHRRLALDGPDDEFRELGRTLDDLFGRLEASFEAQRHFVANASHELRTR